MIPKWLNEFPTHNASVVVGLFIFLLTGIVADVLLALSRPFPTGYDVFLGAVVAMCGVTTIGGIGKRWTDSNYQLAKKGIVPKPPTEAAPSDNPEVKTP